MSLITDKHFTLLILFCFLVIQESHGMYNIFLCVCTEICCALIIVIFLNIYVGCTSSSLKCMSLKEVAPVRLLNRKVFMLFSYFMYIYIVYL